MNEVTVDTSKFSEQLGIYDFFNILITGAVFVFGICAINSTICDYLWNDMSFARGLGILLLVYVAGLVLQELGSYADRKVFNLYRSMSRSMLKSSIDASGNEKLENIVISNSLQIKKYRMYADSVASNLADKTDITRFNDEAYNGYFFSVCQYYVAVKGKDKKIEKMRALFDMSRSLTICFLLLAVITLFAFQPSASTDILTGPICCVDRILIATFSAAIGGFFYLRMKRTMKRFLLILLGTYDAIIRCESSTDNKFDETRKVAAYEN